MPVLKTFTSLTEEEAGEIQFDSHAVLAYLVSDKSNPNSIINLISHSRENARGVQDHITIELWEALNGFYHQAKNWLQKDFSANIEVPTELASLMQNSLMFYGTAEVTMPRSEGWSFINMGKYLERAVQTIDILEINFQEFDYNLDMPLSTSHWQHLLKSVSGYELYLKSYRTGNDTENIADFLLFNLDFPRSVLYCVTRLHQLFEKLRKTSHAETYTKIDYMIGKAKSNLQYTELSEIREQGLAPYLSGIKTELYAIGNQFNINYFACS